MIDTITLALPKIPMYDAIFSQFTNDKKTSWTEFESRPKSHVDTNGVLHENTSSGALQNSVNGAALPFENDLLRFRCYNDTSNFVPVIHSTNIHLPSYDYEVNIFINLSEITFEFSIPKFIFGTNLFQFVPFNNQWAEAYHLLTRFVQFFFLKYCVIQPRLQDIEVRRIDFCYNQFFNSEYETLAYLDQQKSLVSQYSRINSKGYSIRATSINYVTNSYIFKIYWKGAEFAKHDGKRFGKMENCRYDLPGLQAEANKMLRYEMGFRKPFMTTIIKEYIFGNNQKHFSTGLSALQQKVNMLYLALSPNMREKFKSQERGFTFKSDWDVTNDLTVLFNSYNWSFSKDLFVILSHYFLEKVHSYQLNAMPLLEEVIKKLQVKNDEHEILKNVKQKGNHRRSALRIILAAEFLRNHSLNELRNVVPKNTLAQLRKDLRDVGITQLNKDLHVPQPKLDYFDYGLFCNQFNRAHYSTF